MLEEQEISNPQLQEETEQFLQDYTSPEFCSGDKRLVTKQDIARANQLITKIVGDKKPETEGQN